MGGWVPVFAPPCARIINPAYLGRIWLWVYYILGLHRDNRKENGSDHSIFGLHREYGFGYIPYSICLGRTIIIWACSPQTLDLRVPVKGCPESPGAECIRDPSLLKNNLSSCSSVTLQTLELHRKFQVQ